MFPFTLQPLCRHRIAPPSPTPLAHPSILLLPPPFYVSRAKFEVSSWLLFVFVVNDVLSNKNALAYVYHCSHQHNHHHLMPSPSLAPTTLPSLFCVRNYSKWVVLIVVYFFLGLTVSNLTTIIFQCFWPQLLRPSPPCTAIFASWHQQATKTQQSISINSPLLWIAAAAFVTAVTIVPDWWWQQQSRISFSCAVILIIVDTQLK